MLDAELGQVLTAWSLPIGGKKAERMERLAEVIRSRNQDPETYDLSGFVNQGRTSGGHREEEETGQGDSRQMQTARDMIEQGSTVGHREEEETAQGDPKQKRTGADGGMTLMPNITDELQAFKDQVREEIKRGCDEVFQTLTDDFCLALSEVRKHIGEKLKRLQAKTSMRCADIPKYDGDTAWPIFHKQFEAVSALNDWDMEHKATSLVLSLRGKAAEILRTIPDEQLSNYDTLVQQLMNRFGEGHLEQVFKMQLRNKKQQDHESLQEFQSSVERMVHQAYPKASTEMRDDIIAETFINGIKDPAMKETVLLSGKRNIKDILSYALMVEGVKQVAHGSLTQDRKLNKESDKFVELPNSDRLSEGKWRPRCFGCNQQGHLIRECPERGAVSRGTANIKNNNPFSNQIKTCSLQHYSKCVIVEGKIQGKLIEVLIDTGASRSILQRNVIGSSKKLQPSFFKLQTASGQLLPVFGEINQLVVIGKLEFRHKFLVADIVDKCILGLDFMERYAVTISFAKNSITCQHYEIPLITGRRRNLQNAQVGTSERIKCIEARNELTSLVDVEKQKNQPNEGNRQILPDQVFQKLSEQLTKQEKQEVETFLKGNVDIFSRDDRVYGRTNIVKHHINTGDAIPIRQPPRRVPFSKNQEVEEMLENMISEGVIEPSTSPWASPVVLVKKKDGSTRFCVDYRKLNDVTKKDSYPLPRIDDSLDALTGSKWFSTLDLKSGYWQVGLATEDKEKTAFSTGTGLWQFTVMPFGLCNAPATFERLMEHVLRGLLWKQCVVYLDDIIVFSNSFEEHIERLQLVFNRLRNANLKLNVKKCHIFQDKVKYLGHVVSTHGVGADPEKIEAVRQWPRPRDKHELKSFLGLSTYYRRFVFKFADIASPLHELTKTGKGFNWNQSCEMAFQELKEKLCTSPILEYPKPGENFIVDTDASNVGIGGVLSQMIDGEERVISYYSRKLSKQERNYCVTRRELLAVVEVIKSFHKYLYGVKFQLRTDHAALQWLLNFKNPEGQVARWIQRLQEYDYETHHRRGTLHGNADALSRRPCSCKVCSREESTTYVGSLQLTSNEEWTSDNIRKDQLADEIVGRILKWKEGSKRPEWSEISACCGVTKYYWSQWNSLHVKSGVLHRKWEFPDGRRFIMQIVLPRNRIVDVLREIHAGSSGGHLGQNKTLQKIRERFYWAGAKVDVCSWIRCCEQCCATRGPQTRTRGTMNIYNVGMPFERVAMDIIGPLPTSNRGNRYLLVAMDYFSKWPEAYPISSQDAVTIADKFVEEWVTRYGVPQELHSDQGRNFESQIFNQMCSRLEIRKTRTTPLHPQSDGMVERFNRTIKEHLVKVLNGNQKDWDEHVQIFLMAYRTSKHLSTGETPSNIIFGRNIRLPCDVLFGRPPEEPQNTDDYIGALREKMLCVHERCRTQLNASSESMKTRYDRTAKMNNFLEGEKVWLYNPQRRKGICPKLTTCWEGPYTVIKAINDLVYRIQRSPRHKMKVVHLDRLSKYQANFTI